MGIQQWVESHGGVDMPGGGFDLDLEGLKEASKALEAKKHKWGSSSLLIVT